MKKNKIPAYVLIPILVLLVLSIAIMMFILGNTKIFSWEPAIRVVIIVFWLFTSTMITMAYYDN